MEYTDTYQAFKTSTRISDSKERNQGCPDVDLISCTFNSAFGISMHDADPKFHDGLFSDTSRNIEQNCHFTYQVMRPKNARAHEQAIVLLHGLNERMWDKYLPWAYTLACSTGKSVILFPIAFHMNRSPDSWHNPRQMKQYVLDRSNHEATPKSLSIANVALSERLSRHPERFFLSGYQAANDLIELTHSIRSGKHPLFLTGTSVDFFGYSIGVMLLQVLLIANPKDQFSTSKFMFFCGGSAFESMQGTSRYIMDESAYRHTLQFYRNMFRNSAAANGIFGDLLLHSNLGKAFELVLANDLHSKRRLRIFRQHRKDIFTICLTRDHVMLPTEIRETLKGTLVEEIDLPYPYSHEIPFPVFTDEKKLLVDRAFDKVFDKIAKFLS